MSAQRIPEAAGRRADHAYGREATGRGRPSRGRPAPGQMPTEATSRCEQTEGQFQCRAYKAQGTPYCFGHLRARVKLGEVFDDA